MDLDKDIDVKIDLDKSRGSQRDASFAREFRNVFFSDTFFSNFFVFVSFHSSRSSIFGLLIFADADGNAFVERNVCVRLREKNGDSKRCTQPRNDRQGTAILFQ